MKQITSRKGAKAQKNDIQLAVVGSPFSAAKNHAEEFYRLGRAAGQHAILCGMELLRLRETSGIAHGGDRKSSKIKTAACGLDNWETLVEREVGISADTAARWMQAARAQLPAIMGKLSGEEPSGCSEAEMVIEIESWELDSVQGAVAELTQGKTLEQLLLPLDGDGAFDPTRLTGKARDAWEKIVALCEPYDDHHIGPKLFTPEEYEAWHGDALVMRQRVEAGEIPPARAWAGLRGRAATHGAGRADVDHYKNLSTGLTKLRNSLARWDDLGGEERAEIEAVWQELWKQMPGSWKTTAKKLEGWK